MTRKLNILTCLYTLFLILLFLSGSISGIFGEIIYLLSFAIPLAVGIYLTRGEESEISLTINKEKIKFTLPLIMPTVSVIILLSYITSILIFIFFGRTNDVDVGESFVLAIITHAFLPAVLEEMLFRYLPIRLLSRHSHEWTVLGSAFFFALVHRDLFSIPYAFAAGVIFTVIDMATGSVIPSILIHFINNALSVGVIIYGDNPAFVPVLYLIIAILTLISLFFVYRRGKEYSWSVIDAFCFGEKGSVTAPMLIFAAVTLTMAVAALM